VISYPARKRLNDLSDRELAGRFPSFVIGSDTEGNAYGIGGAWLTAGGVACTEARLVYQGYFHLAEHLLEELLYCKIVQTADAVLAGKTPASTVSEFCNAVSDFVAKYECRDASCVDPRTGQVLRMD
jgi:hypothetical protein